MLFFAHEEYLWVVYLASGIVFFFYLYTINRKKRWLKSFSSQSTLLERFSRLPGFWSEILKAFAISASVLGLGLVLLGPKWRTTEKYYEKEGMEIVFVLDVSLSMLAEDVKPDRLQRAKIEIENLVKSLEDDYLGLVVFAGKSFSLLPYLTLDYEKIFLRILRMVNETYSRFVPFGTNIGHALLTALSSFTDRPNEKIAILVTDGEEHIAVRSQVAEAIGLFLEKKNISIYMIGIGDPNKASRIPKKDEHGNIIGYEVDAQGEFIETRPNPSLLQEVAQVTGGTYIHDATGEELRSIFSKAIERHRKITGVRDRSVVKEFFQPILGVALLFLALSLLPETGIKFR
ncbi:MAG TPA: vWA domain-containing protein [Candidatus Brocadiia bacterium]|nr:VWA domain-containing protein [Planctomycetota bacterium]MBI4007411.1 VWA domain-containing protein [Planctomycetota bacterium]MDO8093335.1 VWA domain-containing protein [Candidatus Brocadiales bacterium]